MITVPQIQKMTRCVKKNKKQFADLSSSSDTTCGGRAIAQEDVELVTVVVCGVFLSLCLSRSLFWCCLANVKLGIAYRLPLSSVPAL